jgi:hypothetical protein
MSVSAFVNLKNVFNNFKKIFVDFAFKTSKSNLK